MTALQFNALDVTNLGFQQLNSVGAICPSQHIGATTTINDLNGMRLLQQRLHPNGIVFISTLNTICAFAADKNIEHIRLVCTLY